MGIAGFIPGLTSDYDTLEAAGPESGARLLGLFEVSVHQNIVHLMLAVGMVALGVVKSRRRGGTLTSSEWVTQWQIPRS